MSYFIQGLLPRIRYTVAEQMKNFVEQERGSMLLAASQQLNGDQCALASEILVVYYAPFGRVTRRPLAGPAGLPKTWYQPCMPAQYGPVRSSRGTHVDDGKNRPRRGHLGDGNACEPPEEVLRKTRRAHPRPGHRDDSTLQRWIHRTDHRRHGT